MNAPAGEETLFAEALRRPPQERAAFLAETTRNDPELRRRLESLLASYDAGEFLEQAAASRGDLTLLANVPPTEKPGDRIGRYKLLQQIGEGGCGVVYMAEQEEPVCRRVALKVIKLGMDTRSVIARFEAERQALALMDHPNIAKVLDAGATATGRPYFVMELVRGRKITEYCDEAKLSTRARLDLFMLVCQAIQHAHQKGIIHRDIKPSNILVTVNDGAAVPKVIDFGIAKATAGLKLTDKTLFTAFEQFVGTPAYMSPEQAVLTSLDIDTRSDIYGLGVLLYELLTGRTPFESRDLLAAGFDEMRRTIREREPDRPSTRLSTLPGNELSTTAQSRGIEAPRLVTELRGDLDWIVMKCLEKDRARRYETANGLAADILRHLNNEPVVARPPSRLYRLQKGIRRNRLAFAAGSAVVVSLAVGLTVSSVLFLSERAARRQVDEQAAITQAMNQFVLRDLLGQAGSSSQAGRGFTPDPDLTVREALVRAADTLGGRFQSQPLQEALIRLEVGRAFNGLGQAKRGVTHLERAVKLYQGRLGMGDPRTLTAMGSLALAYRNAGQTEKSIALFEETVQRMKARLGDNDESLWGVIGNMPSAYVSAGRPEEAVALAEQTVKWRSANKGPNDRDTLGAKCNLGSCYRQTGRPDEAVAMLTTTLASMRSNLPPGDPWTQNAMLSLAGCHRDNGDWNRAVPLLEEALNLRQASFGAESATSLTVMESLIEAYRALGRFDLAIPLLEKRVKILRNRPGPASPRTQNAMHDLAVVYRDAGNLTRARSQFEATLQLRKETRGPGHLDTLTEMHDLAQTLAMQREYAGAERLFREALEYLSPASISKPPSPSPLRGDVLHHLAEVLREQKKLSDARALAEDALAQYERHDDWPTFERQHAVEVLTAVLQELGDTRAVEAVRRRHLDALRALAQADDVDALNNLAWILATSRDATQRDGPLAVSYAQRAVAKSGRKIPGLLDTLAASHAEAGDFAKAADTQREALALLPDGERKKGFAARLKLYESGTPLRVP